MALRLLRIAVLDFRFNLFFLAFVTYCPVLPPNGHDCFLPGPPGPLSWRIKNVFMLDGRSSRLSFLSGFALMRRGLHITAHSPAQAAAWHSSLQPRRSRRSQSSGHWELKHRPCCNLQSLYFQAMESEKCLGNVIWECFIFKPNDWASTLYLTIL